MRLVQGEALCKRLPKNPFRAANTPNRSPRDSLNPLDLLTLPQRILAHPQLRLDRIFPNIPHTIPKVFPIPYQPIKIVFLPQCPSLSQNLVDLPRTLPLPSVNHLL